jgi:hypothetical protein
LGQAHPRRSAFAPPTLSAARFRPDPWQLGSPNLEVCPCPLNSFPWHKVTLAQLYPSAQLGSTADPPDLVHQPAVALREAHPSPRCRRLVLGQDSAGAGVSPSSATVCAKAASCAPIKSEADAPACCHTRFSKENQMHLICATGSSLHTYDRRHE